MATRLYSVLADSKPSKFLGETETREEALVWAQELGTRRVFIQQYINGRVGQSWTPTELANELK